MADKLNFRCECLPDGWNRVVTMRKSGIYTGRMDTYYYSPDGRRCRNKAELAQLLDENFNMEDFDWKTGRLISSIKNNNPKNRDKFDFKFGLDYKSLISHKSLNSTKFRRIVENPRVKQASLLKPFDKLEKSVEILNNDLDPSINCLEQPKQALWEKRLINKCKIITDQQSPIIASSYDTGMNGVFKPLPIYGNDEEDKCIVTKINSCLSKKIPIVGQKISKHLHPNQAKNILMLANSNQPYCYPILINDNLLQNQQEVVADLRKQITIILDNLKFTNKF